MKARQYMPLILLAGHGIGALALLFYSFTQIDLALTLSRANVVQAVQRQFQYIGFFNRPLSTVLYLGILIWLFVWYVFTVWATVKQRLSAGQIWRLVGAVTFLLVFSYPAFSYDIFNYMFSAKTVVFYHKNPYVVIPLEFTGYEPWLSFMRWTHLPTAYTPLWILLTLPFYVLGLGTFILTLWSFKILAALFYLGTVLGIKRFLDRAAPKYALTGMIVFALNPLVLVESLVSAHNDIVMMCLAVWGLVLLQERKRFSGLLVVSLSVAMKLMTVFLLPVFVLKWKRWMLLMLMFTGFVLVQFQRSVLPWYFLWVIPFVALLPESVPVFIVSLGFSIGLLLRYAAPIYYGNWNAPVPTIELWVTWIPVGIAVLLAAVWFIIQKFRLAK